MDITPHVNLLRSLRGERIDYVLLIGEGADNSLDAGARRIEISIDDQEVSFQDDGAGITAERIAALFSLGDHGPMTTTQLGRFGIGIKSQAVNAGNIFHVSSTSSEGRVRAQVDWRKILKTGQWSIDDPRWLPAAVGSPTGTTIVISELRRAPTIALDKIANEIAQRFHPALTSGCHIYLNGNRVNAVPDPQLTHLVERQFVLSDGRSAHLRAGILAQPSKLNRVHVAYRHRVIMPASTLGCAEYGGLTKMFARLQLSGPWHLAKFKNDLTDEAEREELEEAVLEALRPILEKCNSASLSARMDEMSRLINELVPGEFATARPQRQKEKPIPDPPPGPRKKRPPGEVDPNKAKDVGPAKSRRPKDRLLITFDGVAEHDGVGAFQPGRPHRVNLSKDDPHVAQLLEHRDRDIGVRSLFALAIALFEQGREGHQPELPMFGTFGQRIARLLSIQQDAESEAV